MTRCTSFNPRLLEVVCQEAVKAGLHAVACDALHLLHQAVMAGSITDIPEADLLRVHITCRQKASHDDIQAVLLRARQLQDEAAAAEEAAGQYARGGKSWRAEGRQPASAAEVAVAQSAEAAFKPLAKLFNRVNT
ncbi:hypothetical protein HaLaN_20564, partial [Haematococcus lacustris]